MLRFLTTSEHAYTIKSFLKVMGDRLPVPIVPVAYSDDTRSEGAQPATCIFSDLERVPPSRLARLSDVWKRLEATGGNRLLNHPTRAKRRYELLRSLHEAGINEFNVYRLTEARRPASYPVFIRREDDHRGSASRLIRNAAEFDRHIRWIERTGLFRDNLLVVEFCDTSDKDGVFWKYGAFYVGGKIMPMHIYCSKQEILKYASQSIVTADTVAEEVRYSNENPHEDQIRRIFELARIDYGRIDYGFRQGRMQVWEINTNPALVPAGAPNPLRQGFLLRCYQWLADTFVEIDT